MFTTEILTFLQEHLNEYLSDLRTLTAIDSGTLYKPGVDAVQSWLQERLQAMGFQVERIAQVRLGDNLLARREGEGGKRILLLGHADTVFPVGTAAQRPMQIDGNILRGPGVCDMKGGLLAGVYAVRALDALGFRRYGALQFLIVSDEEIHDRSSIPLIRQVAKASDIAFTLEAARANGDIVTARKTALWCTVHVRGKAAHAGVEPEKGRNAILALIRHLLEIDKLNGFRPGVTVNIGRIEGGTQPNVVAEEARAELDLRAWRNAEILEVLDAIRAQLARQPSLHSKRSPSKSLSGWASPSKAPAQAVRPTPALWLQRASLCWMASAPSAASTIARMNTSSWTASFLARRCWRC
jgi:glutamate carboxypeptidase